MKTLFARLMFFGLVLFLSVQPATAGKKASAGKNTSSGEITLTGVVVQESSSRAFMLKIAKGFKGEVWFLPASKFKYEEFEGLKVEMVCFARGSDIITVKSMVATDKAAYAAKQAEIKEAAEKEKKASQQKK